MGKIRTVRSHAPPKLAVYKNHYEAPLSDRDLEEIGMPNKCFFMILCGRPASGKTNMALNLIATPGQLYNRVFEKVWVVGPSQHTLPSSALDNLPPEQRKDELTAKTLADIVSAAKKQGGPCLIILDDVAGDLKSGGRALERELQKIILNRRHICPGGLSVLMTLQASVLLPKTLRKQVTDIIVCQKPSVPEVAFLFEEFCQNIVSKAQFWDIVNACNPKGEKYGWMSIHPLKDRDHFFYNKWDRFHIASDSEDSDSTVTSSSESD